MPQVPLRSLCAVAATGTVLALSACNGLDSTDPFAAYTSDTRPHVVACGSGSVTVTPPSTAPVAMCDFGTSFVLVQLSFAGSITVTPQAGQAYQTDPRGRPWGFGACVEGVYALSNTDGPWTAGACSQTGTLPGAAYTMMRGAVRAQWMGPIPNPPESQSSYSGSFTLSYTRVTGTGSVRADKYAIQSGGTVTFTASITPMTVGGGVQVPNSVRWRWVADVPGGSDPSQNCGPTLICATSISSSGSMFGDFVINGEPSSQSVRIAVNTCPPTGDPWMDNPDFRKHLDDDLTASNPGAPGTHEVPGMWYTNDQTGEPFYVPAPTNTTSSPCTFSVPSSPGFPLDDSTRTWQVLTHTHPRYPGQPACDGVSPVLPGPSDRDWTTQTNFNNGTPHPISGCIIQSGAPGQSSSIYCYPDPAAPGQRKYQTFKKQPNGCYVKQP